jgi:hypothetical protein
MLVTPIITATPISLVMNGTTASDDYVMFNANFDAAQSNAYEYYLLTANAHFGPPTRLFDVDMEMLLCDKAASGGMQVPGCTAFNYNPTSADDGGALKIAPTDGNTTHLHKTRCSAGATSNIVTSYTGATYKHCDGFDFPLSVTNSYQIPADFCISECDKMASCVGYMTDTDHCYILGGIENDWSSWIKIS